MNNPYNDDFLRQIEMQAILAKKRRLEDGTYDAPIQNTSARDPSEHLVDVMAHGGSASRLVEAQESAGQKQVAKAAGTRLPAEGTVNGRYEGNPLFDWGSIGVKIGEPIKNDEIWIEAELPEGWSVKPTDHSMWSDLVDDKGRKRAQIFYKAAFYDRSCSITATRRYSTKDIAVSDSKEGRFDGPHYCAILDCDEEIHRIGPFSAGQKPDPGDYDTVWRSYDLARAEGKKYLDEHHPGWDNAANCWED